MYRHSKYAAHLGRDYQTWKRETAAACTDTHRSGARGGRLKPLALLAIAVTAFALLSITPAAAQLGVFSGTKTVTNAGTAVQLTTTNTPFKSGTIQALSSNTGTICIGPSTVLAASKNGVCLTAGQAEPLYNVSTFSHDLSAFWIDSTVNGEGVAYQYEQ